MAVKDLAWPECGCIYLLQHRAYTSHIDCCALYTTIHISILLKSCLPYRRTRLLLTIPLVHPQKRLFVPLYYDVQNCLHLKNNQEHTHTVGNIEQYHHVLCKVRVTWARNQALHHRDSKASTSHTHTHTHTHTHYVHTLCQYILRCPSCGCIWKCTLFLWLWLLPVLLFSYDLKHGCQALPIQHLRVKQLIC